MKKLIYISIFLFSVSLCGQSLKKLLKKYNTESISYVSVDNLKKLLKRPFDSAQGDNTMVLDAREQKEYNVSHLKNAIQVGYDHFDLAKTTLKLTDKNATIVVYCSVGIRSEDVAEKLQKAGYKNVFNLYGGIFEWKNKQNTVVDSLNNSTEKVHTFSKEWSKWLKKGIKVYE
jgi:rhodanese-related sulfurtransferase